MVTCQVNSGPLLPRETAEVIANNQAGGRNMTCRWREPNGTHVGLLFWILLELVLR